MKIVILEQPKTKDQDYKKEWERYPIMKFITFYKGIANYNLKKQAFVSFHFLFLINFCIKYLLKWGIYMTERKQTEPFQILNINLIVLPLFWLCPNGSKNVDTYNEALIVKRRKEINLVLTLQCNIAGTNLN